MTLLGIELKWLAAGLALAGAVACAWEACRS